MSHWLDDYGSSRFRWQRASRDDREIFHRPLGWVETAFDVDGRYHEGRADITSDLTVEIKTNLDPTGVQEKVLLAWSTLRNEHLLLKARSVPWKEHDEASDRMHFIVDIPMSAEESLEDASNHAVFLDDTSTFDPLDFSFHVQNTARVVDPQKSLAKLFVLPQATHNDRTELQMMLIGAHLIMDGLTSMIWARNFVGLLNLPMIVLRHRLEHSVIPSRIETRLPLPQEALYPRILGSRARQRWYWLITRILRHVRKPLVAGFSNPLARHQRQQVFLPARTYDAVLDYTKVPPNNAFPLSARTSVTGAARLHRVCRTARVSIGAGCFALAALLMMEMYEQRYPDIPLAERKPFIAGFPLNPRAFFNHHNEPDSLMLAFSDGILLPFLPSLLPLDGRLRLLARQAHKQLAAYQKRTRPADGKAALQYMSSRGAGHVLSNQYLSSLERSAMLQPHHPRTAVHQPQGNYPARPNTTAQTCGVSSVGRLDIFLKRSMYDLDDKSKDFVADYRSLRAVVRPREGEFLIGIGGDEDGLYVNVSIDLSTMDSALIEIWKHRFETILDEPAVVVHDAAAAARAKM